MGSAGPSVYPPTSTFQPLPHLRTCLPVLWPTGSAMSKRPGHSLGSLPHFLQASKGRPRHPPGLLTLSEPQGSEPSAEATSRSLECPPAHLASYLHKTKAGGGMQNTSGVHGAVHSISILFATVGDYQDDTYLHRSPYSLGNTKSRLRAPGP